MPEDERLDWGSTNHRILIDPGATRLTLFHLLALVLASEKFYALGYDDPVLSLYLSLEEPETHRCLISTAISIRTILDRARGEGWFHSKSKVCGTLAVGLEGKAKVSDLNIREACNKIIHADTIKFAVDDPENPTCLFPIVHLYGKQNTRSWKATLNLLDFTRHVQYLLTMMRREDTSV
jgi:hypothetical protein